MTSRARRRCIEPHRLADYARELGAPDERDAVAEHLEGCGACRQVLTRVRGAQAAMIEIADMSPPLESAASAARMEAALRWAGRGERSRTSWPSWRWTLTLGTATAVAVLLLVLGGPRWRSRPNAQPMVTAHQITTTSASPTPQLRALVTLLAGHVELRRQGRTHLIEPSTEMMDGDALTTAAGGRIALQWGEGSGLSLLASSRLVLVRLETRAQELRLDEGRVAVRVGPHQPGARLRLLSATHLVTVHGTWFVVEAEPRGTTVEVLEGIVEVEPREGAGTATRLAAPMRAFFPAGDGTTEDARTLLAQEAAGLRQTSEMGLLGWPAGAAAGLAEIFSRTGTLHIASTPLASIAVDGVPFGSGSLWLRRPRGAHLVEISRADFRTLSRWVTVGETPGELRSLLIPTAEAAPDGSGEPTAPHELGEPSEPGEMKWIVQSRRQAIRACYERALKLDGHLSGTIALRLHVDARGRVSTTEVESDSLGSPSVVHCLEHEAKRWSFPFARNVTVVYPFTFKSP